MEIKEKEVLSLLNEVLNIDISEMDQDSLLIGAIPELDSMGLVSILTAMEQKYGINMSEHPVSADAFETIGSLVAFIKENT